MLAENMIIFLQISNLILFCLVIRVCLNFEQEFYGYWTIVISTLLFGTSFSFLLILWNII